MADLFKSLLLPNNWNGKKSIRILLGVNHNRQVSKNRFRAREHLRLLRFVVRSCSTSRKGSETGESLIWRQEGGAVQLCGAVVVLHQRTRNYKFLFAKKSNKYEYWSWCAEFSIVQKEDIGDIWKYSPQLNLQTNSEMHLNATGQNQPNQPDQRGARRRQVEKYFM